jgi:hypothetical protein
MCCTIYRAETTFIYHIAQQKNKTKKAQQQQQQRPYTYILLLYSVMMMICWPGHVASRPGPDPGPHQQNNDKYIFFGCGQHSIAIKPIDKSI